MLLWKEDDRAGLVEPRHGHESADDAGFRRPPQALLEFLLRDGEDRRPIGARLGERDTTCAEIRRREAAPSGAGPSLFE